VHRGCDDEEARRDDRSSGDAGNGIHRHATSRRTLVLAATTATTTTTTGRRICIANELPIVFNGDVYHTADSAGHIDQANERSEVGLVAAR